MAANDWIHLPTALPYGTVEWEAAWAPDPGLTLQGREKCLENPPRFLGSSGRSIVTMLTELPQL